MSQTDIFFIIRWWLDLFLIGLIFYPLCKVLFRSFLDKGYIFAKIIGMGLTTYVVFILGVLHIVIFSQIEIILILFLILTITTIITVKKLDRKKKWYQEVFNYNFKLLIFEEILFFLSLLFWSYVRSSQPDIHGLEKYMDFGFVNSILRSNYFPAQDVWFPPEPINYYYFGHMVTAMLSKLSQISSNITFNLMLATLFALTFGSAFSIGLTLYANIAKKLGWIRLITAGLISGFLLTFGGNLHTIYTFFKPYVNDYPVPFWKLSFSPSTFPNSYWYPNATRFIYHTIHEFPIYSFVVSDLHGHVLDIPFVLAALALLLSMYLSKQKSLASFEQSSTLSEDLKFMKVFKYELVIISFLFAVMYMTNAWDILIYFILSIFILGSIIWINLGKIKNLTIFTYRLVLVLLLIIFLSALFILPYAVFFKPFVSGIGVLCAPNFLIQKGTIGPFLFEANHCQRSPLWQLGILYGFFYFWVLSFIVFLKKVKKKSQSDYFVLFLIFLSTILIIVPEFIYLKDIYPEHYRANTMFKLVYQSFIMLSISAAYIIVRIITYIKTIHFSKKYLPLALIYIPIALFLLFLVGVYPYFAITSYYPLPKVATSLDGTKYLSALYPTDYAAILWINKNIKDQPVMLEAQGDSYTDYERVSTNTGLPTVLGWTVHEWLWRGSYSVPAPRIGDVATIYQSHNLILTKFLLKKYNVSYIFIGDLERQKYPSIDEEKFKSLGKIVYQNGQTIIYKLNSLN